MVLTSLSKDPDRRGLPRSVKACSRLSSVVLDRRSAMCCGVMPSDPSDDPRGKVRRALITSSLQTCNGSDRELLLGRLESSGLQLDLDV